MELFLQAPKEHVKGKGCPSCAPNRKLDTKSFVEKCSQVHGDKFCYDNVVYQGCKTKVEILCREHGSFWQRPEAHYSGQGCPMCIGNRLKSTEFFVTQARAVFGERYGYTFAKFVSGDKDLLVECFEHGLFPIRPNNHLNGRGCPNCAVSGYKIEQPAYLYILQSSSLVKIGITNRKPSLRINAIKFSSGISFSEVYSTYDVSGQKMLNIETQLLRELRLQYQQPTEKFDGSTECFYNVDIPKLLERIEELKEV